MQLESKKYLYDIDKATNKINQFLKDKTFTDYKIDDLLKSAVERQFEVIGEALNQLSKVDAATIQQVSDYKQIISLEIFLFMVMLKSMIVWFGIL